MMAELVCPHCGTRNPPGSNFCNRCGAALLGDLDAAPQDPAAPLENQPGASPFDDIDEGEPARPTVASQSGAAGEQPAEFAEDWFEDEEPLLASIPFPDELLAGGAGYLESVSIAGEGPGPEEGAPPAPSPVPTGESDHWRAVRSLMRDEPQLAAAATGGAATALNYRPLWIVLLILLAALLPFLGDDDAAPPPVTVESAGPVRGAWETIRALSVDEVVLVLWQYDPATAGELDLVALPVVSDLLEREARSQVVTLLPGGLASARRLYANAVRGLDESAMKTVTSGWIGSGVFLTGGATALPLIATEGADLVAATPVESVTPRIAVIVASQSDDVRRWLEIVQPVNRLPVVAVTTAAADPTLLPYVQSGQLAGLVSGFDGAAAYQALRAEPLAPDAQRRQNLVTQAQNWGALALLLIVLVANLSRVFWRQRRG